MFHVVCIYNDNYHDFTVSVKVYSELLKCSHVAVRKGINLAMFTSSSVALDDLQTISVMVTLGCCTFSDFSGVCASDFSGVCASDYKERCGVHSQ